MTTSSHQASSIPHLSKEFLAKELTYAKLIPALRKAFASDMVAPRRHVHTLSENPASTLLLMPVWQTHGTTGVKLVTVAPENNEAPSVHAIFILFDKTTGAPLAMMDGEELTLRRTAAASALASAYISRTDSEHLLMIGTGKLIPYLATAHCQVRTIKEITVWGRSQEKAEQSMQAILEQRELPKNIQLSVATDLSKAAAQADVISCATTSRQAIVMGHMVKAGTHLDLVGGFTPNMREVDDTLMAKAQVFVDTYAGALTEAGDITQALANACLQRSAIVGELAELVNGKHRGRSDEQQITVFKSVGTAIEDLCGANLVWKAHVHEKMHHQTQTQDKQNQP
ncbi:ornithine cyclodeaminase family protein [Undibacterium sp. Xuan67W]|uniref:ornithine cyclodeaminase family protein n=1 Tax=Undibacterium sp. Xuan67W TaxID=3413057 RepID=UPI003BF30CA1